MKKIIFIITILIILFSCKTTDGLYSYLNKDSNQIYFFRPLEIKDNSKNINISIDLTISMFNNEIISNPIMNYSIYVPKTKKINSENTYITLDSSYTNTHLKIKPISIDLMYKNIEKDLLEYRFSAELDKEKFTHLIESQNKILITVSLENGKEYSFDSKEFNNKIDEFRIVAW